MRESVRRRAERVLRRLYSGRRTDRGRGRGRITERVQERERSRSAASLRGRRRLVEGRREFRGRNPLEGEPRRIKAKEMLAFFDDLKDTFRNFNNESEDDVTEVVTFLDFWIGDVWYDSIQFYIEYAEDRFSFTGKWRLKQVAYDSYMNWDEDDEDEEIPVEGDYGRIGDNFVFGKRPELVDWD